jgi:8-oxo-dGTP pyrophosphatase MutT (NUDIX family)
MPQEPVRAAGGALWRREPSGELVVALVHRPRYDDWSWPKGKVDPGETLTETALREVEEETGIKGELGAPLVEVTYRDGSGRPKRVTYFEMTPLEIRPRAANDEVDIVRWVPLDRVESMLTWEKDHQVADALRQRLG